MLENHENVLSKSNMNFKSVLINFVDWLNNISWGKFILFVLFISIGKSIIENILGVENNQFIDNAISVFIFVSFGIKFFQKPRINIEIKHNNKI